MDNSTNKTDNFDYKKLQEELNDMRSKYAHLSKNVEMLQNGQVSLKKDIDMINSGFEKINTNFEQVMSKLDKLTSQREESMLHGMSEKAMLEMGKIKRPIRRLFVGALASILTITGSAAEKMATAREEVEDMVAEAHYESRKRRMNAVHQE